MFKFKISGDSALIISGGDVISEEINRSIRKFMAAVNLQNINGIIDLIPSYNELMVCYDPLIISLSDLLARMPEIEKNIDSVGLPPAMVFNIPVLYGGEGGPDISEVAFSNNISEDDVINIHSSGTYLVYMLGFTPGFCYLGGLDSRICTPRKKDPRIRIPAGSIGIAENQTGIYPVESPGGWQLIGLTPVRLFDPGRNPEFLIGAGDYIKFFPVNESEYNSIKSDVSSGTYNVKITGRD